MLLLGGPCSVSQTCPLCGCALQPCTTWSHVRPCSGTPQDLPPHWCHHLPQPWPPSLEDPQSLTPHPVLQRDLWKMSNPRNGDTKPPCLPRNGLVKIPTQPNGLGSASITKGTPAVKNRLCQPSSVPAILSPALAHRSDLPIPSLASPLSLATLASVSSPPGASLVGLNVSEGSEQPSPERLPGSPSERQLAVDEKILNRLFWYFSACEKCVLAQVCKAWRRVLYQPKFWVGLTPVLHTKELYNILPGGEKEFVSLQGFAVRGFDGFCLVGVSDLDICEFIDNYPLSKKGVKSMSLKRSTITDAGLEVGDSVEVTEVAEMCWWRVSPSGLGDTHVGRAFTGHREGVGMAIPQVLPAQGWVQLVQGQEAVRASSLLPGRQSQVRWPCWAVTWQWVTSRALGRGHSCLAGCSPTRA